MANHQQGNGRGPLASPERRQRASSPPLGLADFTWRVVVLLLLLGVAYLLWRGIHVLLLTFAGTLFAIFLCSMSDWLSRQTGMRYGWSLTIIVVVLVLVIGGLTCIFANLLMNQLLKLEQQVPQSLNQIRGYLESTPWGHQVLEKAPQVAESIDPGGMFARLSNLVSGLLSFLMACLVIVIVGIFGAAEPEQYKIGLLYLVPAPQRSRVDQALDAVVFNLRAWLVGQLVLMVMMGVTTAVGLWLFGVPLALTLGLMAGMLEIIPYLGPWISVVPAALIALPVGSQTVVMVLLLYLALHLVEGYLLIPLVQRRAIHLPPALTLMAQILLGELSGIMGLLVAAPLTVSVVVFVKMLYVKDALGEQTVEVPGESDRSTSSEGPPKQDSGEPRPDGDREPTSRSPSARG